MKPSTTLHRALYLVGDGPEHRALALRVARHEAGHAVMAMRFGAKILALELPLDQVTKTGGTCQWQLPVTGRDNHTIQILLAGPAVSLIDGDPDAWSGARDDFAEAEKIMDRYVDGAAMPTIGALVRKVVAAIRSDPLFMDEVGELAVAMLVARSFGHTDLSEIPSVIHLANQYGAGPDRQVGG